MGTRENGGEISMGRPSAGEAGRTGDWRNQRPEMVASLCLAVKQGTETCQMCWAYCPDACITRGIGPVIDLTYCKGCGICASVCPAEAISLVPEHEAGSCDL